MFLLLSTYLVNIKFKLNMNYTEYCKMTFFCKKNVKITLFDTLLFHKEFHFRFFILFQENIIYISNVIFYIKSLYYSFK